ncbi:MULTISPECIES: TRAP transporter small permease [Fusobacterium]|mgnify:FL=1|jgi:C4-dicarboxylate transporter DctQ subunit|uniref:TRAP transporter small permease n=1 Tax=Fusobacterium TaxID=848 RepID=UPI000E49A364|nr:MULTISPECIES: TRAP transporter small permease subunit [Fusobacterium]MCB8565071.1 TRAP transporter small permease subunit [Fusobacterium ulcerans]MCB8648984.1 TRAP transporter small permease subunit [Fusobacterium ulcerans]MDH6458594.1 C4-dicarboxylate transporter DctQ subunit [Fusobacterium sp. PH5-7]RGY64047.1 TRAP transporter small permease [Fusobacterium ulcerans]
MSKSQGFLKEFWDNFEEYLCSIALVVMAVVTFMNVFSRKITWFNMSFSQELVTTMFVWVCCLAAASAFKTDSHMGFAYITDKFRGNTRVVHAWFRLIICCANYGIWVVWGTVMVYRQYKYGLLTGVLEMPSWLIGLAIPLSAVFSIIRMIQYEAAISKDPEEQAKRKGE